MALLLVGVAADEASSLDRRLVRAVHTPTTWSPGASLDETAEEAGYTTGAVYSNFRGKDDLFLAVLDAEAQRRFPLHSALMLDAPSIEEGLRASAREMAQ
jgi:Bacterial regulatory proteins, tetR family